MKEINTVADPKTTGGSSGHSLRGQILTVNFPFAPEGADPRKQALVIGGEEGEDLELLLLSPDQGPDIPGAITLSEKDLESGSLDSARRVNIEKVYRFPESCVAEKNGARVKKSVLEKVWRERTVSASLQHFDVHHRKTEAYVPGAPVPYAGRVFDESEIGNLIHSSLDFWLTAGRFAMDFEKKLAQYIGVRKAHLVNSGSSANLLAFAALTSRDLGDRRVNPGDEVITVAAGFPATITPILQYGCVPVFVDIELPYYNIDASKLEEARSDKTKAVMVAHTLGNPFDLGKVKEFCKKYNLWLIEDNCDALGAEFQIDGEWKKTGSIGDLGTSSFYPPHHMTMGEGGAVYSDNVKLQKIVASFRDWGRDCWCDPGVDNTCGKRFDWQLGELPAGYDHKYIYSHFGYNLKVTDMQAAIGCAQLEKVPSFVEARAKNWKFMREGLEKYSDRFILPEPTPNSRPSWFGFLITIRDDAKFERDELVRHLESKKIQTRMLFAGNFIRHPAFDEIRGTDAYRTIGNLEVTDNVMAKTFWFGVYPGMKESMLTYMLDSIQEFF